MANTPLFSAILILILFLLYGFIHSLLASTKVKLYIKKIIPGDQTYRFIYNIIAIMLLVPIFVLLYILPNQIIYTAKGYTKSILNWLQIISILGAFISVWKTGLLDFLGLAKENPENVSAILHTDGVYRWIRHPIYTFTTLFFWATPNMTFNWFALSLSVSIYCYVGSIYEEKKLLSIFGKQYQIYKNKVKRFIPLIF